MANRTRNIQLKICLNEEEKKFFKTKMKLAKCKTMSHFLRKCVLEKEIYQVDLEPFRELQSLIGRYNANLNQIAKRVNSTGIIYKDDIDEIKKQVAHISREQWQIHSLLLGRTTENGDEE
ncbi:MAG: plasmid mobilization relaxosome protein MobC [Clostridia bacterium]|nr:plasmid mobilization relaxosome protein MobC [Clostridia bacterium]